MLVLRKVTWVGLRALTGSEVPLTVRREEPIRSPCVRGRPDPIRLNGEIVCSGAGLVRCAPSI